MKISRFNTIKEKRIQVIVVLRHSILNNESSSSFWIIYICQPTDDYYPSNSNIEPHFLRIYGGYISTLPRKCISLCLSSCFNERLLFIDLNLGLKYSPKMIENMILV